MANPLLDLLSGVGNVLDTPGSVVRGLLAGDTDRAFGGIMDPSRRVSGRDMLDKWGVTNNESGVLGDVGGFAAQVATDPLTWLGGTLARTILGKGGKAVAAGDAASTTARAADSASTLLEAAPGVGGYKRLADGTIERIAPLEAASTQGVGANGVKTYAAGSKPLSEMEQWTGRRYSMGDDIAEPLGAAGSSGSVSSLLPLRREFTIAKDAGLGATGAPEARFVGGLGNSVDRAKEVFGGSREIMEEMQNVAQSGKTMHGAYSRPERLAVIAEGEGSGVVRHEGLHGLIDIARKSGNTDRLAMLPRVSANLQEMSSPAAQALGLLGEETAAHAVGAGRGLVNQIRGGARFLNNPNSFYAEQLAEKSPLVAALYGNAVLPRGAALGAGVGLGAGGAALINQLGGGQ